VPVRRGGNAKETQPIIATEMNIAPVLENAYIQKKLMQ
jgi:hypothetical protein